MERDLKQPLFGCSGCYEECSLPADDLGAFEGNLYCEDCWAERTYEAEENSNIKNIDFCDLPVFEPDYEKTIKKVVSENEQLQVEVEKYKQDHMDYVEILYNKEAKISVLEAAVEDLTRDRDKYIIFYNESVKTNREALDRLDRIANLQGDEINRAWSIANGEE